MAQVTPAFITKGPPGFVCQLGYPGESMTHSGPPTYLHVGSWHKALEGIFSFNEQLLLQKGHVYQAPMATSHVTTPEMWSIHLYQAHFELDYFSGIAHIQKQVVKCTCWNVVHSLVSSPLRAWLFQRLCPPSKTSCKVCVLALHHLLNGHQSISTCLATENTCFVAYCVVPSQRKAPCLRPQELNIALSIDI